MPDLLTCPICRATYTNLQIDADEFPCCPACKEKRAPSLLDAPPAAPPPKATTNITVAPDPLRPARAPQRAAEPDIAKPPRRTNAFNLPMGLALAPLVAPVGMSVYYTLSFRPNSDLQSATIWGGVCIAISIALLVWARLGHGLALYATACVTLALMCIGVPVGVWIRDGVDFRRFIPQPPPPPDVPFTDEDWRDFTAPDHRFQVEFPGAVVDQLQHAAGLREPARMHVVDLKTRSFIAARFEIPKEELGKIPIEQRLAGARDGMLKNTPQGKLVSEKDIVHAGLAGKEIDIQVGKEGHLVARLIPAGNSFYMLLAGGREYTPAHAEVRRFFGSLRLAPLTIMTPEDFKTNLLAWWSFDDADAKKAIDSSGNGRHLELEGGEYVPGVRGKALRFDGTFSLRLARDDERSPQGWTFAGWFKAAQPQNSMILCVNPTANSVLAVGLDQTKLCAGVGGIEHVRRLRPGRFVVDPKDAERANLSAASVENAVDDRWHHFAVSGLGREPIDVYVDGQRQGQFHFDKEFVLGQVRIGEHFKGCLDELCIYHRRLPEENIQALAGRNPKFVDPLPPRDRKAK